MQRTQPNRVDKNQAAIDECLRAAGAVVISMRGDPGIGFDMLVVHGGQLYAVEVKDGLKPESRRRLTKTEQARSEELWARGVRLHVIKSETEALRMIHR